MDDWGDIGYEDDESRMGRRYAARQRREGMRREQRFAITLAVAAAVMLVLGLGVGFALGRASAPRPEPEPAPVVAEVTETVEPTVTPVAEATESVEPTVSEEPTEPVKPTTPPETPKQLSPDDGDKIDADRVTLKWSAVKADDGTEVTYAFEIQTRVNGKYTNSQTIDNLTKPSYSARVLVNRRRWRVWAIDKYGNVSEKSDWSYYQGVAEQTTTKPSTTTTKTTN